MTHVERATYNAIAVGRDPFADLPAAEVHYAILWLAHRGLISHRGGGWYAIQQEAAA